MGLNNNPPVYLYDAVRTPRAKANLNGGLHQLSSQKLLKPLFEALEARCSLNPVNVEEVILGCVTQYAEQAANVAKTSLMYAGWPEYIPAMSLNRFCSSGLDAVSISAAKITAGFNSLLVAGGVESMSRVPMLADSPTAFIDRNFSNQINMFMMGYGADLIATLYDVDRQAADEIAYKSQQRATKARKGGFFKSIIAIENQAKQLVLEHDECIRPDTNRESLARLAPCFAELGISSGAHAAFLQQHTDLDAIHCVHTVANSPAMADAAALCLIGSESVSSEYSLTPRATIRAVISVNSSAYEVVSGCVKATEEILCRENLNIDDIDLFEIHEAFAATMVYAQKTLHIPSAKLNVNGGCIALGHPLGATGAVMLGVLLDELERRNLRRGLVAMSGAAGAGSAMVIELV